MEIADLGETLATLLDPFADPTRSLKELIGPSLRTLGVVSSRQADVVREGDLIVTVSYYGAAKGGWLARPLVEGEAAHPAWGEATGDLWLNDSIHLQNVPERVWRYELGGYPVLKKWLGYRDERHRPGRGLTFDEVEQLRSIVWRIAGVLALHERLDAAYEKAIAEPFAAEELGLAG
jgi:hypothetical protein